MVYFQHEFDPDSDWLEIFKELKFSAIESANPSTTFLLLSLLLYYHLRPHFFIISLLLYYDLRPVCMFMPARCTPGL